MRGEMVAGRRAERAEAISLENRHNFQIASRARATFDCATKASIQAAHASLSGSDLFSKTAKNRQTS